MYAQAPPPLGKNRPEMGMGMSSNMNMNLNLVDWSEAQMIAMCNGHLDKQELRNVVEYCCKQNNPMMIRDAFINYLGSSNLVRNTSTLLYSTLLYSIPLL